MSEDMNIRNPLHIEINAYSVNTIMSSKTPMDNRELRKFSARLMSEISDACMKAGARDIGHIKAYIEHETGFLFADTLGDPSDVTVEGKSGRPARSFKVVINSVVYGLGEKEIKKATEEALERISAVFELQRSPLVKKETPLQAPDRRHL